MKIVIAAVGASRQVGLAQAIADYEGRIRRYFKLEVREVAAASRRSTPETAAREESEGLLRAVPDGFEIVAIDERGSAWTSERLAAHLEEMAVQARAGAAFLIGGVEGHSPYLRDRADRMLSLSAFTFPHELARLVLAEQIYRAGTILRGEPYHRGR